MRAERYAIVWLARLCTGLLLAASGCALLIGVGILSDDFAVKDTWLGMALSAGGFVGIIAAFALDHRACRAIRRENGAPPMLPNRHYDL